MNDDATFSGRLRRYAKVSGAVSNLALRVAGEKYLGFAIDRPAHAQDLTLALGLIKGPLMKVGQFLATVPGALPPEYADALLKLQTDAPPMGWSFVRRRMSSELGPNWQQKFASFSQEAIAAASLGQVHRAKSLDGQDLACKLQYPDMASAIQADLQQLKLVLSLYEKWGKALDTENVQTEIAARLAEELDYTHEAKNIRLYEHIFQQFPHIETPKVLHDLSTSRLLTMTWMDGHSVLSQINESTDSPNTPTNLLAKNLFFAWYYPLYHHAVIHGDPHPGNYKVTPEGRIQLLDFGCVRIFPPLFVKGVIELYRALQTNDRARAVAAYESWGFQNLNNETIDIITQWAKLLYDPLLDDRIRPIQQTFDGKIGWETATKVHDALEKAGGIAPPREFVFMDRAAVGIGSILMRLKAEQNWHQLFEELIDGFSTETVQNRQIQWIS